MQFSVEMREHVDASFDVAVSKLKLYSCDNSIAL